MGPSPNEPDAPSGRFVETFKEFPPRAKAASFTVADVMEKIAVGSAK